MTSTTTAYLAGLATLPVLGVAFVVLVLVFDKGATTYSCSFCDRVSEPRRGVPQWARSLAVAVHIRSRHGADLRVWQAEHTAKPTWHSRRRFVA